MAPVGGVREVALKTMQPEQVSGTTRTVSVIPEPGPDVIKLFLCSTQLSMKFEMLISIKNI